MGGQAKRRQLRWYRPALANSVWLTVIPGVISAICFAKAGAGSGSGSDAALLFGIVLAVPAVAFLITVRAGFGVGADGVLVRRAYGRGRWVPWAEVKRFDFKEARTSAGRGGFEFQIALIRTDNTRLTIGMWSSEGTYSASRHRMLDELEAARRAASPRLGPWRPD